MFTRAHVTKYMIYSQVLQNKSSGAEVDDDDDVRVRFLSPAEAAK